MSSRDAEAYPAAATQALERLEIDASSVELVHISENLTFRVAASRSEKTYALRLHRPGYQSLAGLKSERQWLAALAAAGLRTPIPVANSHGELLVLVGVDGLQERWASATEWVEGTVLSQVIASPSARDDTATYFTELGRLIATLHEQACAWPLPDGFERPALDADGLMGSAPAWGEFWNHPILTSEERDLLLQTRDAIHAALSRYGRSPQTFSLIHADLHPGNIVVDDDQFTAIDFDDAAFGWHVFDIAVALSQHVLDPRLEDLMAACVQGYRTKRPLADRDAEMAPLFLLSRCMAQLGWLHQRPEIAPSPRLIQLKDWICATASSLKIQP